MYLITIDVFSTGRASSTNMLPLSKCKLDVCAALKS